MFDGIFTLPIENPVLIFFIVLSIILLAPILLNRFRIPHIIGLIIAGIIIGPHGFNILERDSSFEIFGQVGILYLMFLAGIEMDIFSLIRNRKPGTIFGLLTFGVPMVLGTVASHYLLHLDWLTSMLLSSMFASHTLISYPIVSRYGINRYAPVTVAVAGTIFAILGSLIVFAIVTGSLSGDTSVAYWVQFVIKVIAYGLFIIFVYPHLIRWFFKTYSDNVMQFIFVLALVFLSSFIAESIGLLSIIGAFFAGIILNRYIPSVSPLMNRLEFVGNALFIPYFLIGVGMMIDLGIIIEHPEVLLVAVIMCCIALSSKWIAAWLIQLIFHYTPTDRRLIVGITTAKAAVSLAAVIVGRELGVFDNAILNGTIIMILVTCTVSSILTELAASKIVVQLQDKEEPDVTDAAANDERILIPVANPATVDRLVNMALLMKNPKKKSPIYALYVNDDSKASNQYASKRILEQASKAASAVDAQLVPISRYDLNIASGILNTVKENNISEVVLGLHHKANIVDSFFGTKIENMLRGTHKMIWITKCSTPPDTTSRIIVSVPPMAEYETGFVTWIDRLANISQQVGCRIFFYAYESTVPHIRALLNSRPNKVRHEYKIVESWDDMLSLSNVVNEDDLFVVVSARRASVSFNTDYEKLPAFLSQYFSDNNLIVLYPEQFGKANPTITTFHDPLAQSAESSSHGLLGMRDAMEILNRWKRKLLDRVKNS
ncbi:MAG: cation:proton antiporter [Bacteroidaceae bacterium]|nr:cation:proton antiporter [Bacteroidaceae bacterium]